MRKWWLLFLSFFCLTAIAENNIYEGHCQIKDSNWTMSFISDFSLTEESTNALLNGIPLTFNIIVEFYNDDSFFRDGKKIIRPIMLRFNHLTQTYVLSDGLSREESGFGSLDNALNALGTVRDLPVISVGLLNANKKYAIRAKIEFADNLLPVSLRLSTFFSSQWQLDTPWWNCAVNQ